uniref:MBL fold metallo-hydrolase RNA specificity domain-containing protein n=1 Tax=Thiomonas arsenitoxydans (strain DSM 22701 / CIP 110005 / 3As) TaxID=426114 RepID=UPI002101B511|nr:MBL fold metallo-hydrolase RNA specificity domain-containing protein [Thiomonas arsenitoxydans]
MAPRRSSCLAKRFRSTRGSTPSIGFSAHADQRELLAWQQALKPEQTILVHGDPDSMDAFAALLKNTRVQRPKQGDVIDL